MQSTCKVFRDPAIWFASSLFLPIMITFVACLLAGCASWHSDDNTGDMGNIMGSAVAKHVGKQP